MLIESSLVRKICVKGLKTVVRTDLEKPIIIAENRFGSGWTRTNEDVSRGIYSPLQLPLCDAPQKMLAEGLEPSTP